jgi:hypothetical protein
MRAGAEDGGEIGVVGFVVGVGGLAILLGGEGMDETDLEGSGEVVDPDLLDVQEWQIHRKMAVPFAEVDGMVRDVPTYFACRLAQGWLPAHSMIMGQEAKQVLNGETPAQMKKKKRAERRARARAAGPQHGPIDNDVPVYVGRMREDWPGQR